jgi:hypothetical protein
VQRGRKIGRGPYDVAIVGADFRANCNNKVAENMSDLIDISAKPRMALIQGREDDEPTNHQVHSTMYVEDSDKISVAKSKEENIWWDESVQQ